LAQIRCPIVCHCEAFEKSRGNLKSLELRININYHSGYGCSSSCVLEIDHTVFIHVKTAWQTASQIPKPENITL